MNLSDKILKKEEQASLCLRNLYEQFGYKKYKMSKFEEYDFYLENKSFLKTENIITFTDLSGKLMALKPDVTLSIVKNYESDAFEPQKVYYCENVYRTVQGRKEFKEIMQVGLEYIGDIDMYAICEVISLAQKSLLSLSKNYIMDISHTGFVTGLLESENLRYTAREKLLKCIGEKNAHEILKICKSENTSDEFAKNLASLASIYGSFEDAIPKAKKLIANERMENALSELEMLYTSLKAIGAQKNINLDFSIINDMDYYSSIIFQGFIENIPCSVLSGGRYDNLIQKFGKTGGAIGFAVYLDVISMYDTASNGDDIDALIVYSENADTASLLKEADLLAKTGMRVRVQKSFKSSIKYNKIYTFDERGLCEIEKND